MIDFVVLAQTTTSEGAVYAVGGSALTLIATLLIKQGFKVVVGKENGNGKTNGNGSNGNGSNGKPVSPVCAAHDEFSRKLDERNDSIRHALAGITRSQESQQKLLMALVSEVKTSCSKVSSLGNEMSDVNQAIVRLHSRLDLALQGGATATPPPHPHATGDHSETSTRPTSSC